MYVENIVAQNDNCQLHWPQINMLRGALQAERENKDQI
jgi:hypothetical protein